MKNMIIWSTTAILGFAITTGCSDDDNNACVGSKCSIAPCVGAACGDMASDMTTSDLNADVSIADMGQDAKEDTSVTPLRRWTGRSLDWRRRIKQWR